MKKLFLFIIIIIISCRTSQKTSEVVQPKENIDQTQEVGFDQVDYYIKHPSEESFKKLMQLYQDPKTDKIKIIKHFFAHLEKEDVNKFLLEEFKKEPNILKTNDDLKNLLYKSVKSRTDGEFITQLVYLGILDLEPENIDIFKQYNVENSVNLLIKSIENKKFVKESFDAIGNISSADSSTFLIQESKNKKSPHRFYALYYLSNIYDKEEAANLYLDIIKNYKTEISVHLEISLERIKNLVSYLNKSEMEPLKINLVDIRKENPHLVNYINPILDEIKIQTDVISHLPKENLKEKDETKKKLPPTVKRTDPNQKKSTVKKQVEKKPDKKKEKSLKQKQKSQVSVNTNSVKKLEKKEEKKPEEKEKKKNVTVQKISTSHSQKYIKDLEKKMSQIHGIRSKEIMINIHNSLLTYAKSNSNSAKFIIQAYKTFYRIEEENKVRDILNQGIYTENSLKALLSYINDQYERDDIKILSLVQLLNLKRKDAEVFIKNIKEFIK